MTRKKAILSACINLVICFVPLILASIIKRIFHPFQRGFYCDDESISKPYHKDTIASREYWFVGSVLTVLCVVITQYFYAGSSKSSDEDVLLENTQNGGSLYCLLLLRVLWTLAAWLFGIGVTELLTNIGKLSIGRLRPFYLTACDVNWSMVNCTVPGSLMRNYIIGDKYCSWTLSESEKVNARMSFPSGHTSGSCYLALFLILYIEYEVQVSFPFNRVSKAFIQCILGFLAIFVGLSRIFDYKHHPTDVLAGAVVGSVVAMVIVFQVLGLRRRCSKVSVHDRNETLPLLRNRRTDTTDVA